MYNNDHWRRTDIDFIQFLLLIIAVENTIFLLTLLYFLFF